MSGKSLQMSLFEPSMTDTVEVTELYGPEPGGIFDFMGKDDWKPATVHTCWGDLRVMCNVLEDYANILERVIKEWGLTDGPAYMYEIHAARCRKISRKYAEAIGYDYSKALEKCRKIRKRQAANDDIGEEALALLVKRGYNQAKSNGKEVSEDFAVEPPPLDIDMKQTSFF